MYSTLAYLYDQYHMVLLSDSSGAYFTTRYWPVFSKNLKASKNVDNIILIRFLNQEQKPADLTDKIFTFHIIDRAGEELLYSVDLDIIDAIKGHARVLLTSNALDSINPQLANYSITMEEVGGELVEPVYLDDNAGARGVIEISDAALPRFEPSTQVTVPLSEIPNETTYSSEWAPEHYLQTVQYYLDDFEGTITVESSLNGDAPWYKLNTITYDEGPISGAQYINVEGFYGKMRLSVTNSGGNIDRILVR
jgi:hypothetical protein